VTEKTWVNDPVQFLNARLDEAEKRAQAAPPGPWAVEASGSITDAHGKTIVPSIGGAVEGRVSRWPEPPAAAFIIANDPARTLREIDAKRQLIARGGPFCTSECDDPDSEPKDPATNWTTSLEHHTDCDAYMAAGVLAAVYADHPDYKEAWRP
jgi:hypothetical protein